MFDFQSAAIIATLLASIPLAIVVRTVYYAMISERRFVPTDCVIQNHIQPKSDEGEPIQLQLRYSYAVGSSTYTGKRYYFGSINECNSELLARYPAGSRQTVFYDPRNPSRSTLRVGVHPRLWLWGFAALISYPLFWLGILAVLHGEWKIGPGA